MFPSRCRFYSVQLYKYVALLKGEQKLVHTHYRIQTVTQPTAKSFDDYVSK